MDRLGDVVPGQVRVGGVPDQPGELLEEERVAARARGGPGSQGLVGLPAETYGEQVPRRLLGQSGHAEAFGGRRPREPREHRAERSCWRCVLHAVGAQQHDRGVADQPGQRRQEQQARLVGPVEVLEHDQQGAGPARLADEEVRHRVVQRRLCEVGPLGHPGSAHHHTSRTVTRDARQVAKDLRPRPVGRAVARLVGPADGHHRAGGTSPRGDLLRQPGLPDPGLARHHPDRTVALRAATYGLLEEVDLGVATQERVPARRSRRSRCFRWTGRHTLDDGFGPRRGPVQRRVLLQELGVQASKRGTGIHPHVLGELVAQCLVGGQGVGLSTAPVERQQPQGVEALAQRLADEQVLRRGGRVRRPYRPRAGPPPGSPGHAAPGRRAAGPRRLPPARARRPRRSAGLPSPGTAPRRAARGRRRDRWSPGREPRRPTA